MIDATEDSEKSSKHLPTPSSTSFRHSLIYLFGKDAAKLCKSSSQLTQKLASHSCHISFLKACRDHNIIPKGLRLTDPIKTQRSQQVVTEASSRLITERLNHFRHDFSRKKKTLDHTIRQLEGLLDPTYMTKNHHLNGQKSSLTHRQHIKTHRKKFADLLEESNSPFLSPYDSMTALHFTSPSFHGPLSTTTLKQKTETTLKKVVNLSDAHLSPTELEVLNLGLKFVPTPKQDPTAQLAPLIQNVAKRLPDGMESSAIHQSPDNHHPCRLQSKTRQDS